MSRISYFYPGCLRTGTSLVRVTCGKARNYYNTYKNNVLFHNSVLINYMRNYTNIRYKSLIARWCEEKVRKVSNLSVIQGANECFITQALLFWLIKSKNSVKNGDAY